MEPVDSQNQQGLNLKSTSPDRVILGPDASSKLSAWLDQVNAAYKGFLSLSKSDLVNFLIQQEKVELTAKQLSRLRAIHYDPLKHISWISQELKIALATSDAEAVSRLQTEIRTIEISQAVGPRSTVGIRRKSSGRKRKAAPSEFSAIENPEGAIPS